MHFLYNITIGFYGLMIRVAAIFNAKAKLWIVGRKNWKQGIPKIDQNRDVYWFHCASLGEFDQGLPVMKALKNKMPSAFILVTFFSPSGFLHYNKRKHFANHVMYLPLDTDANSSFFLDVFKPVKIYFVKYEFWANYIFQAKMRGIGMYSVSSNFRGSQLYFKWYGRFFKDILRQIDHFFVQTDESKRLLNSIGVKSVTVVGDTRFDQVVEVKNQMLENVKNGEVGSDFVKIENFLQDQKAIVIGSSWPAEEEKLLPFIIKNTSQKFILAPHDISEDHLHALESKLQTTALRFSQYDGNISEANCLILDTIGHLSKVYAYGKIAIIGGGFTGKLHNILEPASYGLPVLFGPKHDKFPEAQILIAKGLAFEFSTASEVELKLNELLATADSYNLKIQETVHSFLGASDQIIELST